MYITSRLHAHEAFKIYKYRFENICFLCDIIFAYTVTFLTLTMNCNWTSTLIKVIKSINVLPSIAACLVIKLRKKMKYDRWHLFNYYHYSNYKILILCWSRYNICLIWIIWFKASNTLNAINCVEDNIQCITGKPFEWDFFLHGFFF